MLQNESIILQRLALSAIEQLALHSLPSMSSPQVLGAFAYLNSNRS